MFLATWFFKLCFMVCGSHTMLLALIAPACHAKGGRSILSSDFASCLFTVHWLRNIKSPQKQTHALAHMGTMANSASLQDSCWLCWWTHPHPTSPAKSYWFPNHCQNLPGIQNKPFCRNVHHTTIPNAEAIMVSQHGWRSCHMGSCG